MANPFGYSPYTPRDAMSIVGPYSQAAIAPVQVQRIQPTGNESEIGALGMFATSFLEGAREARQRKMMEQENSLVRNVQMAQADLERILADPNLTPQAKEQAQEAYKNFIGTALHSGAKSGDKKNPIVGFVSNFAQGLLGGQVPDKATQSNPGDFFAQLSQIRNDPANSMDTQRTQARQQFSQAYQTAMQEIGKGEFTTLSDLMRNEGFRNSLDRLQQYGIDPIKTGLIAVMPEARTAEEQVLRQRLAARMTPPPGQPGQAPPGQAASGQPQAAVAEAVAQPGVAQGAQLLAGGEPAGVGGEAAPQTGTQPQQTPPQAAQATGQPPSRTLRVGDVDVRLMPGPQPTQQQFETMLVGAKTSNETFYDTRTRKPVTLTVVVDPLNEWTGVYDPNTKQRVDTAFLSKDIPKGKEPPDPSAIESAAESAKIVLDAAVQNGIIDKANYDRLLRVSQDKINRGEFDAAERLYNNFIDSQLRRKESEAAKAESRQTTAALRGFQQQLAQSNLASKVIGQFDNSLEGKNMAQMTAATAATRELVQNAMMNPRKYDTAQVHTALLTLFAKALDPNSVVRPSEYEAAAKTLGVLNYNLNRLKGEIQGKGNTMMTRQDMQKFLNVIDSIALANYTVGRRKAETLSRTIGRGLVELQPRDFGSVATFEDMFPDLALRYDTRQQQIQQRRERQGQQRGQAPPSPAQRPQNLPPGEQTRPTIRFPNQQPGQPAPPGSPEARRAANPFANPQAGSTGASAQPKPRLGVF